MIAARSPHLQAMGIQQWMRRDLPLPESPSETVELVGNVVDFSDRISLQGATAPLLLITIPLDRQAEQLLAAMLSAIGVEQNGYQRLVVDDETLFADSDFVTFMQRQIEDSGSRLQLQLGGAALPVQQLYHTFHPSHLLQHPEEKRGAWEALKRLHAALARL